MKQTTTVQIQVGSQPLKERLENNQSFLSLPIPFWKNKVQEIIWKLTKLSLRQVFFFFLTTTTTTTTISISTSSNSSSTTMQTTITFTQTITPGFSTLMVLLSVLPITILFRRRLQRTIT